MKIYLVFNFIMQKDAQDLRTREKKKDENTKNLFKKVQNQCRLAKTPEKILALSQSISTSQWLLGTNFTFRINSVGFLTIHNLSEWNRTGFSKNQFLFARVAGIKIHLFFQSDNCDRQH